MWVAPEARGAGVGAALVEATARWAPGRGATTLRTSVTIGNDGARIGVDEGPTGRALGGAVAVLAAVGGAV